MIFYTVSLCFMDLTKTEKNKIKIATRRDKNRGKEKI